MGKRYLPGDDRIVPAHVRLRVSGPMFELDAKPHAELLEIATARLFD